MENKTEIGDVQVAQRHHPKSPTEKQIEYVDRITEVLNLDFPHSSRDFTRAKYREFISAYAKEYWDAIRSEDPSDDDEMLWFPMLNG